MDYKKLLEILRGHRIWIQTHNFPDPDAIASAYGLQYFLDYFGIPSKICYNGNVDKISVSKMISTFQIEMSPIDEVQIRTDDYVVLVDGQKYNANLTDIPGIEVAVIDHHKTVKSCEYFDRSVHPGCKGTDDEKGCFRAFLWTENGHGFHEPGSHQAGY